MSLLIFVSLGQDVTPSVLNALAQGATGWQLYDETDSRLIYGNGTWQTFNVSEAVGGTLTGTADPGATLTAYFEGTGINVIYSKGPEGGTYSGLIDHYWVQYRNSYAETYSYSHNLTFDGLEYGQHRLSVQNGDGAIWIEAIQVQGSLLNFLTTESVTLTPGVQAVGSMDSELDAGRSYFYLGDESKELTMSSSASDGWVYDSIEWPNDITEEPTLDSSRNPIIGTCFTAELSGPVGSYVQYAEMGSENDKVNGTPQYPYPWQSFYLDSSGWGKGSYSTCIAADHTTPPGRQSITSLTLCAQVCPGADQDLIGDRRASWPKFTDTDYVATWKVGFQKEGTLQISDMRLIYMCPWYGEYGGNHNCIYTYQPSLAASYAIMYRASVNNNFCSYNFFNYGGWICTDSDDTDCANFVSQALHFGGLPMRTDWYCKKGAVLPNGQSYCGHGGQSGTWSGADDGAGLPSMLIGLPGAIHITDGSIPNMGTVVIPNLNTEVRYGDESPTTEATIIQISADLAANGITQGDVMYTNASATTDHVILVVGWGPYLTTWDQIKANTLLYSSPSTEHPIPYVIDHGNHFLLATDASQTNPLWAAWASGPKPYYSLPWGYPVRENENDPNDTSFMEDKDWIAAPPPWAFIHIPTGELTFSFEEGTGTLELEPEFNSRYLNQWNRPMRDR
jgi:hypothetical protein